MAKNGQAHEGGKVGGIAPLPPKFFSVDSYDLKSMSLKFGNDIFITFEMPSHHCYYDILEKIILSLFRPSVIRGPWVEVPRICIY